MDWYKARHRQYQSPTACLLAPLSNPQLFAAAAALPRLLKWQIGVSYPRLVLVFHCRRFCPVTHFFRQQIVLRRPPPRANARVPVYYGPTPFVIHLSQMRHFLSCRCDGLRSSCRFQIFAPESPSLLLFFICLTASQCCEPPPCLRFTTM